jgi:Zn ribbon nucleic-acid-binding protein|tara:strand:- start:186 stop:401 length:216 start_codon:yes stop_codon:yes gene_type:complete
MARIGKLTSQIVTGKCPECQTETILVSFEPYLYRCVNCGYDLEQKINGVIKYVVANEHTEMKLRDLDEDHG